VSAKRGMRPNFLFDSGSGAASIDRPMTRCSSVRPARKIPPSRGGAVPVFDTRNLLAERLPSPHLDHALIQAMAFELVIETEATLSRQSQFDLVQWAHKVVDKPISASTIWRILHQAAIKPWQYEHWLFPRDPKFAEKAGPILDLYAGTWHGHPLGPKDHVLSLDEKPSFQARKRKHDETQAQPKPRGKETRRQRKCPERSGTPELKSRKSKANGRRRKRKRRIEHEYKRQGALQYLAGWDVRHGRVIGRCEPKTGIKPLGLLVEQILNQPP
jgi:hypothetical protein